MARKMKLTPQLIDEVCQFIKKGQLIKDVCNYVGIHESTFYRWMNEGEQANSGIKKEFYESVKKAESQAKMATVSMILSSAKKTWQAAAWYLERRYPDEWGKKERLSADIEHSGQIKSQQEAKVNIEHQITVDEESRELLKQLWRRKREIQKQEGATW